MKQLRSEEIKRKLRQLKRLEEKIRFNGNGRPDSQLIWSEFFDTRDVSPDREKYPLEKLTAMSKEEYKAVVDAYFAYVYYELYKENDTQLLQNHYNPEILRELGLPHDAGVQDIKRKFRELAKEYHPDTGGDAAKFIELMDTYRQLIEK